MHKSPLWSAFPMTGPCPLLALGKHLSGLPATRIPSHSLPTSWVPSLTGIREQGRESGLHLVGRHNSPLDAGRTLRKDWPPPKTEALRRLTPDRRTLHAAQTIPLPHPNDPPPERGRLRRALPSRVPPIFAPDSTSSFADPTLRKAFRKASLFVRLGSTPSSVAASPLRGSPP